MVYKHKLEHKENNVVTVTNNNVKYYEDLASQHARDAANSVLKAASFANNAEEYLSSCQTIKDNLKEDVLLHSENCENPHNVTSEQVGAYSKTEVDNLLDEKLAEKNPNLVAGANISIIDNSDGTQTITSENTVLSDYNLFENKPSINNVSLSGNKTSQDLGLALLSDLPIKVSQLQNDSGYLTAVPSQYVTETELESKGYLTEHQSLDGYATEQWVENKGYLTSIPAEYVTETILDTALDDKQDSLVSGVNIKTINNQSILGEGNITIETESGTSNYDELENRPQINNVTLTGNKSLSDLGIQPTGNYVVANSNEVAIGKNSLANANNSVAVGRNASAEAQYSVAIGEYTGTSGGLFSVAIGSNSSASALKAVSINSNYVTGEKAISINCEQINGTANTFKVYDYTLLDGTSGKIPDERLSGNIATTAYVQNIVGNIETLLGEV